MLTPALKVITNYPNLSISPGLIASTLAILSLRITCPHALNQIFQPLQKKSTIDTGYESSTERTSFPACYTR